MLQVSWQSVEYPSASSIASVHHFQIFVSLILLHILQITSVHKVTYFFTCNETFTSSAMTLQAASLKLPYFIPKNLTIWSELIKYVSLVFAIKLDFLMEDVVSYKDFNESSQSRAYDYYSIILFDPNRYRISGGLKQKEILLDNSYRWQGKYSILVPESNNCLSFHFILV